MIKEEFKGELEIIESYIDNLYGFLEYVKDYGHVGHYDKTSDLKGRLEYIIEELQNIDITADEIVEIIKDQFQY